MSMTEAEFEKFKQRWIEYQRKHYPSPKDREELAAARREREREQKRRYYADNKERINEQRRQYYAEHREERREYQRRYRERYYTPLKSDVQDTERS